jgi:hypothetical protein
LADEVLDVRRRDAVPRGLQPQRALAKHLAVDGADERLPAHGRPETQLEGVPALGDGGLVAAAEALEEVGPLLRVRLLQEEEHRDAVVVALAQLLLRVDEVLRVVGRHDGP